MFLFIQFFFSERYREGIIVNIMDGGGAEGLGRVWWRIQPQGPAVSREHLERGSGQGESRSAKVPLDHELPP